MQAITKTADDGMYVITRGCSQMSRVPQKINNIVEIFSFNGCRLRTPNVRRKGGQKLAKSCGHLLCMTPISVMIADFTKISL